MSQQICYHSIPKLIIQSFEIWYEIIYKTQMYVIAFIAQQKKSNI